MSSFTDAPVRRTEVDDERTQVLFTVDELWILQRCIRHELPQMEQWKYPPANLDFNHQIAEALLFCVQHNQKEAVLRLCMGDLLAIDYMVPNDMKDMNGVPIGRVILMKSYSARGILSEGYPYTVTSEEPSDYPSKVKVQQLLSQQKGE